MLTKPRYSIKEMIVWTRWELLCFFLIALVITACYSFGLTFLGDVPFFVRTQRRSHVYKVTYDRLWRQASP